LDLRGLTSNEREGRKDGTEWQGEEKGKGRGGEEDGMGKHRKGMDLPDQRQTVYVIRACMKKPRNRHG